MKTMTPKEFVKQWIKKNGLPLETVSTLLESRIVDIVSNYHKNQVNSVDLADVVELLPSDEEIEKEAELRYPVETHSAPINSPYVVSKKTFIEGCNYVRFLAERQ